MKYLVISIIFLALSFLIVNFTGTEIVAHNLIMSSVLLFALVEIVDQIVTRTLFRDN